MQVLPQRAVVAKLGIAGHRGHANPRGPRLPQQRQPPLLLKANGRRNLHTLPGGVGQPRLGEIQRRVQHPCAHTGRQRGRHRDLTMGDFARRAAVLTRHADRVRPLFGKARLIEDQDAHRSTSTEMCPPFGVNLIAFDKRFVSPC